MRMSNRLDPNQARQIVGPDLGPNCLQRLSADNTGRERVNRHMTSNVLYMELGIYHKFLVYRQYCRTLNL